MLKRAILIIVVSMLTGYCSSRYLNAEGLRTEGFILRGTLTNASSDGTPYFNIGEAIVLMLPEKSALEPGLKNLVGKKIVITVLPDESVSGNASIRNKER